MQAFAATRDATGRNGFVEIGFERLVELRLPVRRRGRGGVGSEPSESRVKSSARDPFFFGKRPEALQKLLKARRGGRHAVCGLIERRDDSRRPAKRQRKHGEYV